MVRSFAGKIALVVGIAAVGSFGCNKKKDDEKGSGKTESVKADEGGTKKGKGAATYAIGDVLKHVPGDCKGGRVYLDLSRLLKNEGLEKSAEALEEKLASSMKKGDAKAAGKAFKKLKKAGIDPARDVREVALCLDSSKDEPVIAFGGAFADKDPIEAVRQAIDEASESDTKKKETEEGIPYIKNDGFFFAAVTPNVVVLTKDKGSLAKLAKDRDPDDAWNAGKGRILAFDVKDKKTGNFSGQITEDGDDLKVVFAVDFKGELGENIADDPKNFKRGLEEQLAKVSTRLRKGPFKKIADDLREAKIKVDGSKVTLTLTVPAADLGDALKRAAEADEAELAAAIDL
jgi:hypothetical protein